MAKVRAICVYCGASPGNNPTHLAAARTFGADVAGAGVELIYGGGTRGIMGEVARACLRSHGTVVGVIPEFLADREARREDLALLSEVIVTADMHERKTRMFERADAFVALPGGIGTLEELVEMLTWAQLGRHTKPVVLANIDGFWQPLIDLLAHMADAGFLHARERFAPLVIDGANAILPAILDYAAARPDINEGDSGVISRL